MRQGGRETDSRTFEKGEVLLRGVGTLRYLLILSENSACQVPICAVAASWFDNPHQKVVPRSQIPRSTSHFSLYPRLASLDVDDECARAALTESPASRRGRDKRGFHRRATNSIHFIIVCFKCAHVATFCYILLHFAIFCHMLPCIFPWKFTRGNRGTSATTAFVLTPSGSCQPKTRRAAREATTRLLTACSLPRSGPERCSAEHPSITTRNTTTTCVPSFFCPRSRNTSEVVRRALGLYFH